MTLALRQTVARTTRRGINFAAYSRVVAEPTVSGRPMLLYSIHGIVVPVVWDVDQWVALEEITGFYGEGDTPNAAVSDLLETLVDHVRDLVAHTGRLAPEYTRQLSALGHLLPK